MAFGRVDFPIRERTVGLPGTNTPDFFERNPRVTAVPVVRGFLQAEDKLLVQAAPILLGPPLQLLIGLVRNVSNRNVRQKSP